jgi:hypothetical protein
MVEPAGNATGVEVPAAAVNALGVRRIGELADARSLPEQLEHC